MNTLGFFLFDPMYLVMVMLPGMAIAGWAQWKLKSTYARTSQIASQRGLTGAEAARMIIQGMNSNLLVRHNSEFDAKQVTIEETQGYLSDHYDPSTKTLRLSPDVYHGNSLAALGIAAHEAGHALQDAEAYSPLKLRNSIVPIANIGSSASYIFLLLGFFMQIPELLLFGIILFFGIVIFQLVNLPCEFNASSRAREQLLSLGMVTSAEDAEVKSVLNAAAMTYVAAALTAVLTLLYYVLQFSAMNDD